MGLKSLLVLSPYLLLVRGLWAAKATWKKTRA